MAIRDQWLTKTPRREGLFFPIEQTFNKFFDEFFNSNPISSIKANSGYPRLNAFESDGKFSITISVPGMTAENISAEIDKDNVLTIKGQMSEEHHAPENAKYYLRELRQSSFERKLILPDHIV